MYNGADDDCGNRLSLCRIGVESVILVVRLSPAGGDGVSHDGVL